MTIFRCARLNQHENIDVATEIAAINRVLEKRFPDCTVQRLDVGNDGQASQWVTVELEITPQSVACATWYAQELEQRGIVLQERGRSRPLEL